MDYKDAVVVSLALVCGFAGGSFGGRLASLQVSLLAQVSGQRGHNAPIFKNTLYARNQKILEGLIVPGTCLWPVAR